MTRDPVDKRDWLDWKAQEVSKALIHDLIAVRETYKEGWADGKFVDEEAYYRGMVAAYADILEYITKTFDVVSIGEDEDELESN